jgi:N-succinyldiaminopimelate aminotransferase
MPGGVYAPSAGRRDASAACPLNVGDTWLEPFVGGRMEDLHQALPCERDSVLVAAGATGALCTAVGMLAAPGEEVLILAPFWPLIRGIVQAFRATPVEVPFYDRVDTPANAIAAVRSRLTSRTVALYVSTPSNPTGRVIPSGWLEALADFARREDLWLISDEVYEDYVYAGEHFSVACCAPERSLTVYSFSKAYGMAGFRTGYLVGPAEAVAHAEKIGTHTFYSAPTAGQIAGLRALRDGGPWLDRARALYRAIGTETAAALGLPAPQGSTFHFVDVSGRLDERGISGFLEDCLDDGVALAPGASCGEAYAEWVRLCYTAAPPDEVTVAVCKLAKRLS